MFFPHTLRELLTGRYSFPKCAHLTEELFHAARGLKENEHLPLTVAGHRERVGDSTRGESRVPWREGDCVISDLNKEFSSDDIKPLVLGIVTMKGRAAFGGPHGIVDAKIASGVLSRDLEVKAASHDRQRCIVSILLEPDTETAAKALLVFREGLGASRNRGQCSCRKR